MYIVDPARNLKSSGTHILKFLFAQFDQAPRRVLSILAACCLAMLTFGMYLQEVVGLVPCPMCIVQRYALILVMLCAAITACSKRPIVHVLGGALLFLFASGGAYVAANQSWLQWYPPEVVSCGRDLYGMIETFPLQRVIPMIFKGGGDCTKVDWTFLGGTIANWSFLSFMTFALFGAVFAWRRWHNR